MDGGRRKRKSGAVSSVARRHLLEIKKRNVVPAADRAPNKRSTAGGFFSDQMVNEILLRLPSGSCIVRFRCVCKMWNILLSRPSSIHKILFGPGVDSTGSDETAQVLVKGAADDNGDGYATSHFVYSLLSYKHLLPITPIGKDPDLPCVPNKDGTTSDFELDLSIVGCCDGIVCIADKLYSNASDIILWNPATSETKILPRSPFSGDRTGPDGRLFDELIGFGFDSQTNDYKVIRSISADSFDFDDFEPVRPDPWSVVEMYSLRNDSWRRIDGQDSPVVSNPVRYPHTYRGEMLYWWKSGREDTQMLSWDFGKEVFDWIDFPKPTGKYGWAADSCTLLKDSIVGVFSDCRGNRCRDRCFEIRVLLKFDQSVPWTLLYRVSDLAGAYEFPAIWRGGCYFVDIKLFGCFSCQNAGLLVLDPETDLLRGVGTKDKAMIEIVTFVPSQMSLSGFKMED
ncbi:unnamed protein product [Linum tenue]|uniref:F-box domain-containing protein n=1 Tax=Linum tenue TaxID=586396 RepID=A0AAV0IMU7_9ROSI|nr:unnamed protein product [Linum tenue]